MHRYLQIFAVLALLPYLSSVLAARVILQQQIPISYPQQQGAEQTVEASSGLLWDKFQPSQAPATAPTSEFRRARSGSTPQHATCSLTPRRPPGGLGSAAS